jgi:hypothetical protein
LTTQKKGGLLSGERLVSTHFSMKGLPMTRFNSLAACLSLVAGLCVYSAECIAQEKKKEQQQPPAPQPGPEHSHLAAQAGTWDCVVTGADGKKSKAVSTSRMECGGLWLVSDFKGDMDGKPFQGRGLDSYDPAKKKYVGVWVDSMVTTPLFFEGTRDAATKTTTSTCECPGPDGKPMKMRAVSKEIDNDHATFEMYMTGPDGKEAKMMTIDYTRRK